MTSSADKRTRLRSAIVGAFFLIALAVISGQVIRLDVFQGAWLSERAAREYEHALVVQGKRGAITDRNGTPLAVSIDAPSIAAYPRQIADRRTAARKLARALHEPKRSRRWGSKGSALSPNTADTIPIRRWRPNWWVFPASTDMAWRGWNITSMPP
jgi:cell division protein FtsI/penicillin-binding protein 2